MKKIKEIEFTRISNDSNGNPRYVCHFLNLITDKDREEAYKPKFDKLGIEIKKSIFGIDTLYVMALNKARKLGGRKYHNKKYGGGIVFQSYNIKDLQTEILKLIN